MTESVSPTQARSAVLSRRVWLGAAVAAGLAGGATAWWRYRVPPADGGAESGAMAELWGTRLPSPDGKDVALSDFRGRKLVVNFWATWCPPCVEELPLLDQFQQAERANGWSVVALAVDQSQAVRQFLAAHPLGLTVAIAGQQGLTLSRALGNAVGGLPFTVVLSADGAVAQRKIGKLQAADLQAWRGLP